MEDRRINLIWSWVRMPAPDDLQTTKRWWVYK